MKSKFTFSVLIMTMGLVVLGVNSVMAADNPARPAGAGTGWVAYTTDYLGRDNSCGPGLAKWDFVIKDYNTNTIISDPQGLQFEVMVWDNRTRSIVNVASNFNQAISPAVCWQPGTQSVWPRIYGGWTSNYYTFHPVGHVGTGDSNNVGRYVRGSVHLQQKGKTPTARAISLNQVISNDSSPTLAFETYSPSTLYGATNNSYYAIGVWNADGSRATSYSSTWDSGVGIGVRSRTYNLADGRYVWRYSTSRNAAPAMTDNFDTSCGTGQERVDFTLKETGTDNLISMNGMSGTAKVHNKSDGSVVKTISWLAGNPITSTTCFNLATQNITFEVTADAGAGYLNNGDTLSLEQAVAQNSAGKNYFRVNIFVPKRVGPIYTSVTANPAPVFTLDFTHDGFSWKFSQVPQMSLSQVAPFVIDTIPPTASVTANPAGYVSGANVFLDISTTVRDLTSGMAGVRFVIEPITGEAINPSDYSLVFSDVGVGDAGGSTDPKLVGPYRPLVTPGARYTYYVVATDVAGNIYTSPTQTITAPITPPDLNVGDFNVIDPCTSDELSGAGICPAIKMTLKIQNTGVSIPAGQSIPYRIEYQLNGESIWRTGPSGNWNGGLAAGATTGNINVSLTGISYGDHLVRARVNYPVNSALNEINTSNNISPTLHLAVGPTPPDLTIGATQQIVRYNQSAEIYWRISAPYSLTCQLTGPGVTQTINHRGGVTDTSASPIKSAPLTDKQDFVLDCSGSVYAGFTIPGVRKVLTVEVVPQTQEI